MANTNEKIVRNSDELSIREVFIQINRGRKYLLSKWKIILLTGFIGSLIGLGYAVFKKPVYGAELTFALEDDKSTGGLGAAAGLASQFGIDLGGGGGGAFSGDNLLALMKSRLIVERTLLTQVPVNGQMKTLAELYIDYNKFRKGWQEQLQLANIKFPSSDRSNFSLKQDSLLGTFYDQIVKKNLMVDKVDKKLTIITVDFESENELFSKLFTDVLVKTVSDFYIATKTKKSVLNVEILQRQTDSIRRELNAALLGVASSGDVNPNPNPALQILRVPSQRRQVDVQADQAILTQLVANLEISKVTLRRETPLIQIIDSPILPLNKKKLGKTKGVLIGGILAVLLTVIYFAGKSLFDNLNIHED